MGFEKALKSIERNPTDAENVGAYLLLITQEKNADRKAEALVGLALAVVSADPVGAFDYVESAFKLAPNNGTVLRTLVTLFERRGQRDAADSVRSFMKKDALPPVPVPIRSMGMGGEAPRSAFPSLRKPKGLRETRSPSAEKDLCRKFLRECGIDESHLPAAAEFVNSSHSVSGLVHFCHYLVFAGHVREADAAIVWVKELVDGSPPSAPARLRYRELLAPLLKRRGPD